jgi:NAD(P)-dependent dehydrogenase (short-subunit alcohol dehydrogenase family)
VTKIDLSGRVVIVTGAGRGIGRAHARLIAARGAAVVVCDSGGDTDGQGASTAPADTVVAEIAQAGGRAVASYESVGTRTGADRIVATALDAFGSLDAVVNNAGIFDVMPFEQVTSETVRAYLTVHFEGSLFLASAAWRHLIGSGTGRIVNTVSGVMLGVPNMVHYGSAKGAVYGLTRNLAVAGAAHGIPGQRDRAGRRNADGRAHRGQPAT